MKDVPQPSGQSVTLQASACGRPVVLTRTRGLWDPEQLRDGENVLLVAARRPGRSRRSRRTASSPTRSTAESLGRSARATVEATASVEGYAARLLEICGARSGLVPGRGLRYAARWHSGRSRAPPLVHARSAFARQLAHADGARPRAARGRARRRRESSTRTPFAPPPSGGGNQFLRALEGELRAPRAHRRGEPDLRQTRAPASSTGPTRPSPRLRRFIRGDVRMGALASTVRRVYRGLRQRHGPRIGR